MMAMCPKCEGEDIQGHARYYGSNDDALQCLDCGYVWSVADDTPATFDCWSCQRVVTLSHVR